MVSHHRIDAVLLIAVDLAINLSFLFGLMARPSISYHITTPLNYNETIDLSVNTLRADFRTINRGRSEASIWLRINYYNASLASHDDAIPSEGVDGRLSVARLLTGQVDYQSFNASFASVGNVSYIVVILSVEVNNDASLGTRFHNSFAVFNPERPTALLLRHIAGNTFMRVSSR